jgi:hypothetical protein
VSPLGLAINSTAKLVYGWLMGKWLGAMFGTRWNPDARRTRVSDPNMGAAKRCCQLGHIQAAPLPQLESAMCVRRYSVRRLPAVIIAMGSAVWVFLTSDWITLDPEKDTVSAIMGMNELWSPKPAFPVTSRLCVGV